MRRHEMSTTQIHNLNVQSQNMKNVLTKTFIFAELDIRAIPKLQFYRTRNKATNSTIIFCQNRDKDETFCTALVYNDLSQKPRNRDRIWLNMHENSSTRESNDPILYQKNVNLQTYANRENVSALSKKSNTPVIYHSDIRTHVTIEGV